MSLTTTLAYSKPLVIRKDEKVPVNGTIVNGPCSSCCASTKTVTNNFSVLSPLDSFSDLALDASVGSIQNRDDYGYRTEIEIGKFSALTISGSTYNLQFGINNNELYYNRQQCYQTIIDADKQDHYNTSNYDPDPHFYLYILRSSTTQTQCALKFRALNGLLYKVRRELISGIYYYIIYPPGASIGTNVVYISLTGNQTQVLCAFSDARNQSGNSQYAIIELFDYTQAASNNYGIPGYHYGVGYYKNFSEIKTEMEKQVPVIIQANVWYANNKLDLELNNTSVVNFYAIKNFNMFSIEQTEIYPNVLDILQYTQQGTSRYVKYYYYLFKYDIETTTAGNYDTTFESTTGDTVEVMKTKYNVNYMFNRVNAELIGSGVITKRIGTTLGVQSEYLMFDQDLILYPSNIISANGTGIPSNQYFNITNFESTLYSYKINRVRYNVILSTAQLGDKCVEKLTEEFTTRPGIEWFNYTSAAHNYAIGENTQIPTANQKYYYPRQDALHYMDLVNQGWNPIFFNPGFISFQRELTANNYHATPTAELTGAYSYLLQYIGCGISPQTQYQNSAQLPTNVSKPPNIWCTEAFKNFSNCSKITQRDINNLVTFDNNANHNVAGSPMITCGDPTLMGRNGGIPIRQRESRCTRDWCPFYVSGNNSYFQYGGDV